MRSLAPVPATDVTEPPGYPREWEADVLLTDGGVAHLRPIRPSDAERLVAFYDRVSPESKYLRFFAPYPRLSERDVVRFTHVDYVDRVAFILTLGEEMIAVGRYDRIEGATAEVAFLIEDAHQGRGIGQLLLEHLAEAARERGITRFVAEVLPQNRRMAQVFADAGYRVSKGFEDGVLNVEFPILPTDTSVGVMERREHRAERASVERLLTPGRLVVYGKGDRVQGLVDSIVKGGFGGEVVAVCTDGSVTAAVTTAPTLAEVEGRLDLALVSVPTAELGGVVIDIAHKGAHGIVVLTGTDVGASDNLTVINLARAYGVRALGPDALGLINTAPAVELNATPGPMPRRGGVGLFCQSAAVGVAVLNHAVRQDLGLSSFISTGDYADVTANDAMQYWEDDAATRICLLSLDSIGNPRKFSRITRRLTRRKPVVVFAPGRASRSAHIGVRGGLGHAPDEAVDALFRQAGVMVVHRRGAMIDIAKIAARQPLPAGQRVRIVTNSTTLGAQMCQTCRRGGAAPGESAGAARRGRRSGGVRGGGAGRARRSRLRFRGLRSGERVRRGHRGRDHGVGGGGGRGGETAGRCVPGLPPADDEQRLGRRRRTPAPLRRCGRRRPGAVGADRVRALAGPRPGGGAVAGGRRERGPAGGESGARRGTGGPRAD